MKNELKNENIDVQNLRAATVELPAHGGNGAPAVGNDRTHATALVAAVQLDVETAGALALTTIPTVTRKTPLKMVSCLNKSFRL